ncbi:hypothetical protein L596_026010 [Steinernema carpocapsae]|uniref:Uncharacterized protein n=1 Tax=Steinernema carpocapsae TaxID=34508 RepID=A0A4U5M053_STECR|nr:hypothetical protein L596_026010 [Steinernema carpocapsae]
MSVTLDKNHIIDPNVVQTIRLNHVQDVLEFDRIDFFSIVLTRSSEFVGEFFEILGVELCGYKLKNLFEEEHGNGVHH